MNTSKIVGWMLPGRTPIRLTELVPFQRVVRGAIVPILFVRLEHVVLVHPTRWDRFQFVFDALPQVGDW